MVTTYIILPFVVAKRGGKLLPCPAQKAKDATRAIAAAERMAGQYAGIVVLEEQCWTLLRPEGTSRLRSKDGAGDRQLRLRSAGAPTLRADSVIFMRLQDDDLAIGTNHRRTMPLYVLEIGGQNAFSINAHDYEGAEILARWCLDDDMSPGTHVLLRTEDESASWSRPQPRKFTDRVRRRRLPRP